MNPILHHSAALRKINLRDSDTWWTDDDPGGYEYQTSVNKDFMKSIEQYFEETFDVAIQAGGNCGWLTREISKRFKTTYTFEPHHTSFVCLCLNVPDENVFKMQCCLGPANGLIQLGNDTGSASAGFVKDSGGNVPMISIDSLNLRTCDFIQLDLEGFEYFALLGAINTIKAFKPMLCIEVCWGERFGVTKEKLFELIEGDLGYKLVGRLTEINGAPSDDYIFKHAERV